ncbi:MAG: glycosyltransferase [Candidatus Hydrogenedentes bacterium]|nr:glycosyltransferase [Candidatus Hydrogenedentota bacterium]
MLLPVWNAAATLPAAVDSVRNQTFQDWELLVVDDGSTDESPEIAGKLAREDARIRTLHTPHRGIVAALNTAAEAARGRLLARMDADDLSLPHRLEAQRALLEADPGIGLCGGVVRITGEPVGSGARRYEAWVNGLLTHREIVREILVECPVPHPTFLMPKALFEELGGYRDCGWPEDYDLVLRVWRAGRRFAKPSVPVLEWRDHGRRLSRTDPRYAEAAFRRCKRHYLAESGLWDGRRFFQWGAGEVGKRWLREWETLRPEAVVDINPRKIGRTIHGTPVIAPPDLPPPDGVFVVAAVGTPGARDDIRTRLLPRGYAEGEDFLFLA